MTVVITPGEGAKRLAAALKEIESKVGNVGWITGSRYEDVNGKAGLPVAHVAAIQEFGSPSNNIPARPFLRPTITAKKQVWSKLGEDGIRAVFKGKATISVVMEKIGQAAAGDIKEAITRLVSPPLAPSTIAARVAKSNLSKARRSDLSSKIRKGDKLNAKDQKSIGGLTKPLIDTGVMLNTLTNSVEDA
jgi:hypothetical protein